jgi:hypothetical protein
MSIHCDTCGRVVDPTRALEREWDGELFWFCDDTCLLKGRHITVPAADPDVDTQPGPAAGGALDDEEL